MKLFKKTVLGFTISMLLACVSYAESDDIKVMVNDVPIKSDVSPILINDRTMVPLRSIFEALDATVEYDEATEKITSTRDNVKIEMYVNDININKFIYAEKKNGDKYEILQNEYVLINIKSDVAPQIVDSRTLVPVRVISECMGCGINWNEKTKTVEITQQTKEKGGKQ